MHPIRLPRGQALKRTWSRVPSRPWGVVVLWCLGLALGAALVWSARYLPPGAAAGLWAMALAAAAYLAWRGEPELWTDTPLAPETEAVPGPGPDQVPEPMPVIPPLLDLVEIPGGEFVMGSVPATDAEIAAISVGWHADQVRDWRKREEPAHRVRISAFAMARTPLTRGQWRAVMAEAPEAWAGGDPDDRLPATHVDWTQALACCNALSEREGLTPCYRQGPDGDWQWDRSADGYRLPSEAEWEYACRAGTQSYWFWGNQWEGAERYAWYQGYSESRLSPVGKKLPNPWGLADIAGLVYEWCWDRYGPYPGDPAPPIADPSGPSEGSSRVVRGGSFLDPPGALRPALRAVVRPDGRDDVLGLRCVRSRARQH